MSEKYNQDCERLAHAWAGTALQVCRNLAFHSLHLCTRHLTVQNTLKADQRDVVHPWEKSCASQQGELEPSLQKPVPTQTHTFHCFVGASSVPCVCEVSPPVVMGPLYTQGRRFLLERQREMGTARGSQSPLSTLQLTDLCAAAQAA